MPTFQSYYNGEKVAEFSGADPKGLENMIKRCAQLLYQTHYPTGYQTASAAHATG